MKQFFSFLLILMAAIIAPQRSAARASIAIDDITVIPGATTTIEVKYAANGLESQGIQFKVEIPAGLTFVEGSWKLGPAIPADNFTMGNHDIFRDGTCIFFSIANSGSKMNVPDGVIVTFDVACDENLDWEENTVKVFDAFVAQGVSYADFEVPVVRGTAFTLEDGMFLRIKADDSHYLCMPEDSEDDITFDGTGTEKGSIFYWNGSTLLSYMNGMYVTKDEDYLVASTEANDNVEFTMTQQGNMFVVSYVVGVDRKKNPIYGYMVFDEAGEVTLDASRNESDATPLTFEALETLPVTTNASGYVTLYSPVALTVPEGVKAYTAAYDADQAAVILTETTTVPAACGVIVEAEDFAAHTFDFPLSEEDATPAGDLSGSYTTIEAVEGAYTLQRVDDEIGFYSFTGENLSGFKAYLTGVTAQSVRMVKEGNLTAISGSIANSTVNAEVYDLQGRRIAKSNPASGLYINGGKIIVK